MNHPIVKKFLAGENDAGGTISDLEREVQRLISVLDAIGYTRENDPVKLKTMAREAIKNHRGSLTPLAVDAAKAVCKCDTGYPFATHPICGICGLPRH